MFLLGLIVGTFVGCVVGGTICLWMVYITERDNQTISKIVASRKNRKE